MRKALLAACFALALTGQAAPKSAELKLWRLDCGAAAEMPIAIFSDVEAYPGQKKTLVGSCYLIRHGDRYMLWDTGLPAATKDHPADPAKPFEVTKITLVEQLARIGVRPAQVSIVGISHYHYDHIGQGGSFPAATLLIGKGDLEALKAKDRSADMPLGGLAAWVTGTGKADPVSGDKDVFGDGSVTMIGLPGHTPGHHALLVRLPRTGNVLLSGDVTHFRENYESGGIAAFNTDRADSIASLDRFKGLARNLKAIVVIQHDPRDIGKLPAFPAAAD